MAQLTIDTEKDSAQAMRKMIELLEHFITEKGGEPLVTNMTSSNSNPFAMFNQSDNQYSDSGQNSSSTPTATHNSDIFSMFSNDTPSSSPQSYGYTDSTSISAVGLSAQDLLKQVDNEPSEESEEKKDQDFFQLMQY